jgi:hypothetical protein
MSRSSSSRRVLCEPLEGRLLCKILNNGEFVIAPPGGGEGHSTIHMQPEEGLTGLRAAEANSGGPHGPVVNWEITATHEWTPGDEGGPHSAS